MALRYELSWADCDRGTEALTSLLEPIGGNPYRLALAFYALRTDTVITNNAEAKLIDAAVTEIIIGLVLTEIQATCGDSKAVIRYSR